MFSEKILLFKNFSSMFSENYNENGTTIVFMFHEIFNKLDTRTLYTLSDQLYINFLNI